MSMFGFKKRKRLQIKTVANSDLEEYLKSLDVLTSIKSGERKCEMCGRSITLANLEAIVPKNEKILFVCSNIKCVEQI